MHSALKQQDLGFRGERVKDFLVHIQCSSGPPKLLSGVTQGQSQAQGSALIQQRECGGVAFQAAVSSVHMLLCAMQTPLVLVWSALEWDPTHATGDAVVKAFQCLQDGWGDDPCITQTKEG